MDYRDVFDQVPFDVIVRRNPVTGKEARVASFVCGQKYAANFGKQWARFRDVQLDSVNGTSISRDYFEQLLRSPLGSLKGKAVLEVGAGAGRFTEHFVRHAGEVVAIDLSEAIYVNTALGASNLVAAQADLLSMPPMRMKFDLVYCRGVLQHTPDPVRSISQLHRWVKTGGMVIFDIYAPGSLGCLDAKYLWRRIIPRLFTYESFSDLLERSAATLLRVRWALKPLLPGRVKRILDFVLPVYDYKGVHPLGDDQLIEWGKLDTLDAFFARYDHPMPCHEVLAVLGRIGAEIISVDRRRNFFRTTVPSCIRHESGGRRLSLPADAPQ